MFCLIDFLIEFWRDLEPEIDKNIMFKELVLKSIFHGFGMEFGSQMGSKIDEKSIKD